MPNIRTRWVVVGVVVSFLGLVGAILYSRMADAISGELARLMVAGLIALYVGFGFLILVYRFVRDLE